MESLTIKFKKSGVSSTGNTSNIPNPVHPMHPHPSPGPDAALRYLIARNALPKLQVPVPVLFRTDARQAEAIRRGRRAAAESRSRGSRRRLAAWGIGLPFTFFSLNR